MRTTHARASPDTTTVKVAQGATYQLNVSDTVAGIEGAGNINGGALTGATVTLTVSGNTTAFSGVIGDGASGGKLALNKVGSGTLTLSGLNTYTGTTSVNAGTLSLSEGAYRSPSFAIATGAVLQLHTDTRLDYSTSTSFSGAGTLRKTGSGTVLWGASAATFAMGSGGLIDVQGGMFIGGSSANENWANNLASLNVAANAQFRTVEADVRIDALTGSGSVQMGYGGYANSGLTIGVNNFAAGSYNSAGSANFSGTLFDFGRLIKAGTGVLTLSGNSTHTGATTVQAGTLRLGIDQAFSANSALTINPGASFDLNGKRQSLLSVVQGTGTGVATLSLGTGGLLEINGNNLTFAGTISGDGSLRKVGNTTLTLSGANTYTGETHIVQGTVTLGTHAALGPELRNGVAPTNTAVIIGESGSLNLNGFNQRIGSLSGAGSLTLGTGVLTVGNNNTDTSFTGVFSGTGTGALGTAGNGYLIKEGSGTLFLGGATSNSTGRAVVNAGMLVLDKASGISDIYALSATTGVVSLQINSGGTVRLAGGGSSQIATTSNVVVNTGGTLDLNGRTLTLNELTGSGSVTNARAGSSSTLTVGYGGTAVFTFAGTLSDGVASGSTPGGKLGLTKVSSGTLVLTAVQAYTGDTTINGGALQLAMNNVVYGVNAGTSVTIDGGAVITVSGLVLDAASGTWTLTLPPERELSASLTGSLYTVTVMATDKAGNRSLSNTRDQLRLSSAETTGAGLPITHPGDLTAYAGQIGQLYSITVTGELPQVGAVLQGSDLYTLSTRLNVAAVHAGLVAVGETKTVSVMVMPSGSSPASTRNGITTTAMSGVGYSFVRSELTPLGISLASSGDSATAGDNLTRQLAPALRISLPGSVQAGDTLRLASGSTEILRHTLTATDLVNRGTSAAPAYWVELQAHILFNGSTTYNTLNGNAITAQVMRVDNGAFQGSAFATLQSLSIDSVVPNAPPAPALERGDDLGNTQVSGHQSDNRINRGNQFSLSGTVYGSQGTVMVEVWAGTRLLGSTGVSADNRWSFFLPATAAPLPNGSHNITVVAIDAAGNRSDASAALALIVDTAIGKPSNLAIHTSYDSGIKGDNITLRSVDSVFLITGRADTGATNSTSLRVFDDTNNNGVMDAGEELAIYMPSSHQWVGTNGTFNLYLDAYQLAEGNASETAVKVQIYANGTLLGEAYPDTEAPFAFSFTYNGNALTPGSYLLEAQAIDVLGLPGLKASFSVVFDDKLPPPSRLTLNPLDDSGIDNTDGFTKLITGLRISGTAEPGVKVSIFDDLNDNNLIDDGELLGTVTADATTGAFSSTISLGSGNHRLRAIASDTEGNISLASASLPLTVDRQPASAPDAITLLSNSDTGLRSNDRLTADNQPTFRITLPQDAQVGDVVWLTYAAYVSDPNHPYVLGTWTLTAADIVDGGRGYVDIESRQVMADRAWTTASGYFIGAYIVDMAGNMGRMQVLPSLQIDTVAPNPSTAPSSYPPAPLLASMDDSGSSRSDGITVVNKGFTLYGTVPAGTRRVELFDGDTSLGYAQMLSDTSWTYNHTAAAYGPSTRVFTLTATDEAGNVSRRSLPLMITFDANPPAKLWAPSLLAASDSGRLNSDGVTSTSFGIAFTGFANPSAAVRLYNDRDNNGTLDKLQAVVTAAVNAQAIALNTLVGYADNGGTAPILSVYSNAGVTGVDSDNLAAINSALASTTITGALVDTTAEVQAIVDAYAAILAEANGSTADATGTDPSVLTYQTVGVSLGSIATNTNGLSLLNDLVGERSASAVDSVSDLNTLADAVNRLLVVASGGTASPAFTASELNALLGISTVTPDIGERIMRIAKTDDAEVEAWLPIADAVDLKVGDSIVLYLQAELKQPYTHDLMAVQRGLLSMDANAQSLAGQYLRHALSVVIRELKP